MKKFISLLLCAVMLLMPMTVFASEYPEETLIKMGDSNFDGNITAADARNVLRISANLDSAEGLSLLSIDADGNGKISSADARLILRKSAGLSEFTYGFDGKGIANSLNALKSDTFSLSVAYDGMEFEIIKKNENIHVIGSEVGADMSALGMENCGIMLIDNMLYLTYVTTLDDGSSADVAMYIPESLYDDLEMTGDDIHALAQDITNMLPEEFDAPEKIENNGEVSYIYNVNVNNAVSRITVDAYGVIQSIASVDPFGNAVETVMIAAVSAEVADGHFDIERFELI